MRMTVRFLLALVLVFVTASAAVAAQKVWVCPMAEHTQQFDKPGACPICGMQLVEKDAQFRVAVLVFNNVEDIDFTAPIEIFGESGARVFTVGVTADPINTVFGLHLRPDYDLAHAPAADVVLVPGGGIGDTLKKPEVLDWLRARAASTKYVLSVCNGAFFLQKAGLLDGLSATTTAHNIERLAAIAPKTHVVRERVVDNGKIITAAGLSAGIDGALHVLEREYGRVRAEDVARGAEYRWDPDSHWSRAALADSRFPNIDLPEVNWVTKASSGDMSHWSVVGRLETARTAADLRQDVTKQFASAGWTAGKDGFDKVADGHTWVTTMDLAPATGGFDVTMTIHRAD